MKRALFSVTDKTDIVKLAQGFKNNGYEIISTGGTLKAILDGGIEAKSVEEITDFPEILDGRVKTLNPKIHGGILAKRDSKTHIETLREMDITKIDAVVCNLYDFEGALKSGKSDAEIIENIDIGGPSMIRSAAKNFKDVLIITDHKDYDEVLKRLENDDFDYDFRQLLAMKAFSQTAYYDAMISRYFAKKVGEESDTLTIGLKEIQKLRYGENPHQKAKLYQDPMAEGLLSNYKQLHGKELSFNNLNDLNIAIEMAAELKRQKFIGAVALKHASPCGAGIGDNVFEAFEKAYKADPISIFGGIVATTDEIDEKTAKLMNEIFLEIVAAPKFSDEALEILKQKKNLRILIVDLDTDNIEDDFKFISGKVLRQDRDKDAKEEYNIVTKKSPSDAEKNDLLFGMIVCKFAKSNAIVIAKDGMTLGIGGGQTSRIWALQNIYHNNPDRDFKAAVLASDAFFPFDDCVKLAAKMGISAIIQPGGSIRDKDSIDKCNEENIAMVFTNTRHFRH
ncbi:MAG: bifunctional phosphoribosylaminoimidazolecarboxamide formyltransferase/IMP cyclohydrolase [Tissierellia bacterium]|nr:bifunctional phosphoribosylaminoimidazolecarboxamide formyltransferase/IMP cyclohydrolase [Tissierellia bacterium]